MNKMDFYIGDSTGAWSLIPPPDNWKTLELELSFENGSPEATLNTSQLIFKAENAVTLNNWFKSGLTGGLGIFEGVPFKIQICSTNQIVFNGIIDLTDDSTIWNCDIVKVKIRDKRMDMVSQLFDSISYAYLASPKANILSTNGGAGLIIPKIIPEGGDYVAIPYQHNDIPDYIQVFSLALAIYNIAEKTHDAAVKLVALVSAAVAEAATVLGLVAVLGLIIEILGYLVYLTLMVLVIVMLFKAAINYMVSPVLTKLGMYAETIMKKTCDYFGLGFSSTILQNAPYNKLVIMPQKPAWPDNRSLTRTIFDSVFGTTVNNTMLYDDYTNLHNSGFAYGYPDGTCGDFVRSMETVFNAKAKIIFDNNGVPILHFERWDYIYNQANYTLPNISDQSPFKQSFSTNAAAIPANYMVKYAMDTTDVNTYNDYLGTSCYATTRPNHQLYLNNVVLQNLVEKNFIYSQATSKEKPTLTEEILFPIYSIICGFVTAIDDVYNAFADVYNSIAAVFGVDPLPKKTPPPSNPSWVGTDYMLLERHTTSQPKMFIAGYPVTTNNTIMPGFNTDYSSITCPSGVTVHVNNKDILGAKTLFKNFHFSNLGKTVNPGPPYTTFAAGTPYYNQYLEYKDMKIPLCCDDWSHIKNNNIIRTFDNKFARVDSLRWNIYKGLATINYRTNDRYTNNLNVSYVIDGSLNTTAI